MNDYRPLSNLEWVAMFRLMERATATAKDQILQRAAECGREDALYAMADAVDVQYADQPVGS